MIEIYKIEGCEHRKDDLCQYLNDPNYYPTFQEEYYAFKNLVKHYVNTKSPASFIHFGDGDYFFLKGEGIGSAAPGKRALSISYDKIDLNVFREGFKNNTHHCLEVYELQNKQYFKELYPELIKNTIPTEFIYGCLMNKWYLQEFKGRIGLIGGKEKLSLIKELMKYQEYKDYLGIDNFNDYIEIPQKFACDDLTTTVEMVRRQMEHSNPETCIYLFGVGHVKSGLIQYLPKMKNAVYIDVGCGIDGLAGCLDPERPLALGWINFRLASYDYSKIDYLQYNVNQDKKKIILS